MAGSSWKAGLRRVRAGHWLSGTACASTCLHPQACCCALDERNTTALGCCTYRGGCIPGKLKILKNC